MPKSCDTSRSTISRNSFALGVATLLTISGVVDAFAENCKTMSRSEIAKVMVAIPYEGRLRKAFECLGQPNEEQIGSIKCLSFKKDGKAFFEDCEDKKERWQMVDMYTPNVTVERRDKTPPTQSAKMAPASGFGSAPRESDAARSNRLLEEQNRLLQEQINAQKNAKADAWIANQEMMKNNCVAGGGKWSSFWGSCGR
ncbi:MAG: hypothetical protein ACD_65C00318G0001 [uncultured bacterium]|nr:MAG: hypothetical protein ACD_65C00318G0001 [uncultured bacterium]